MDFTTFTPYAAPAGALVGVGLHMLSGFKKGEKFDPEYLLDALVGFALGGGLGELRAAATGNPVDAFFSGLTAGATIKVFARAIVKQAKGNQPEG